MKIEVRCYREDNIRVGKMVNDMTRGSDMARFGKIWQDLARFDKGGHGKI